MLKEYIAQKEWIVAPRPAVRIVTDMIEFCTKNMPKWYPVSISGYHIREAGATAVQELAFTLADGIGYMIVGLNAFKSEKAAPIEILHIDEKVAEEQKARLAQVKAERNNDAVQAALAKVEAAARGTDNMMPPVLEAVKAYATLGEICDVFRPSSPSGRGHGSNRAAGWSRGPCPAGARPPRPCARSYPSLACRRATPEHRRGDRRREPGGSGFARPSARWG
jgi:methylmalonyl-CoA mutase N-terminal domain/subunit